MSITSNVKQSELLLYWGTYHFKSDWIRVCNLFQNRLTIHLSNYWWAGISNFVCSTILVITEIYIYISPFLTSVLLLIMRSQPTSIAWTGTSTAAIYNCWSYIEHSVLYIFDTKIVWPYEICEFIWFLIW